MSHNVFGLYPTLSPNFFWSITPSLPTQLCGFPRIKVSLAIQIFLGVCPPTGAAAEFRFCFLYVPSVRCSILGTWGLCSLWMKNWCFLSNWNHVYSENFGRVFNHESYQRNLEQNGVNTEGLCHFSWLQMKADCCYYPSLSHPFYHNLSPTLPSSTQDALAILEPVMILGFKKTFSS